jgi:hypothetical protein
MPNGDGTDSEGNCDEGYHKNPDTGECEPDGPVDPPDAPRSAARADDDVLGEIETLLRRLEGLARNPEERRLVSGMQDLFKKLRQPENAPHAPGVLGILRDTLQKSLRLESARDAVGRKDFAGARKSLEGLGDRRLLDAVDVLEIRRKSLELLQSAPRRTRDNGGR